jgi:hypothetical protein
VRLWRAAACSLAAGWLLLAACATDAAADVNKDRCVDSNTKAQSLRRRGRFAEVRAVLQICGDPGCPSIVVNDCVERLDELNRAQPTLILDVKDSVGNDVGDVKLTVDGVALTDRVGGDPINVDPGEHTFLFESPGRRSLTRTFVLREGEKNRLERIVLPLLPAPEPPAAETPRAPQADAASEAPSQEPRGGLSERRIWALVGAGLGVAGVATGAVLGLDAASNYNAQKRDCGSPTNCPNHAQALTDHAAMQTSGTWSTVAFVAGAALLGGATWLFFTDSTGPARPATGRLNGAVAPAISPSSAGLIVRAEF